MTLDDHLNALGVIPKPLPAPEPQTPDRTSAPWWQDANRKADATLFIAGKVKFLRPDGSEGKSPGTGTTLFASGDRAVGALAYAQMNGLGVVMRKV